MKSQTNTSHGQENLINEWVASNSGIMTFNPNNISTSISTHRLNLVEAMVGASNATFMRRV
jgi:hypothetical protein